MRLLLVLGGVAMLGTNLQAEPKAGVDLAQLKGWDILLGADAIPSDRLTEGALFDQCRAMQPAFPLQHRAGQRFRYRGTVPGPR